jgi:polyphosphate kinase 2 (PPK2 family)
MTFEELIFNPKKDIWDYNPSYTAGYVNKEDCSQRLNEGLKKLTELQEKLYAYNKFSLLIIFQAMDAAGKEGTIKHIISGVNPQGCQVKGF